MSVVLSESDIFASSLMEEIHRSWKTTSYVFGLNAVMIPPKVYAQKPGVLRKKKQLELFPLVHDQAMHLRMQEIQEALGTAMEIWTTWIKRPCNCTNLFVLLSVPELPVPAPSVEYVEFCAPQIVFRGQIRMLSTCVKHRQGLKILWY